MKRATFLLRSSCLDSGFTTTFDGAKIGWSDRLEFPVAFLRLRVLENMAQESWKMEQDDTGCQLSEGLILCSNNCGFFGSATTMNLCSKCYRDFVLLKQTGAANLVSSVVNHPEDRTQRQSLQEAPDVVIEASSSQTTPGDGTATIECNQQSPMELRNRCFLCKKRLGLIAPKCRCGNVFCYMHRYSDRHNCPFDYRTAGRDAIAKANPVIKADKVEKI
eukprot:c24427_g1_i2 orf=354-1010(+)